MLLKLKLNLTTLLPQDCGHDLTDDSALFAVNPAAEAASTEQRVHSSPECTVLAWDERMMLHTEGRAAPHPERPDRLRAVMARLLNSGIAGPTPLWIQFPVPVLSSFLDIICHTLDTKLDRV